MKILVLLLPLMSLGSNLHELINLSLKNEQYLIAQMQEQGARLHSEEAFKSYLPKLSLNLGYVQRDENSLIYPKQSSYANFSLKFLLFDGGEREATLRALRSKERISLLNREQNENYLALNAITLYFNSLSLEKILSSNAQKLAFLKSNLERLEKFYKVGLSSRDEFYSIEARYHLSLLQFNKNQLELANIQKQIQILSSTDFKPQAGASLKDPNDEGGSDYAILLAKENLNIAKQDLNIARSQYLPKLYVQNNYGFYKNHHHLKLPQPYASKAEHFINKYDQKNEFILGVKWTVFDFNARAKRVERERLNLQIANAHLRLNERKNTEELGYLKKNLAVLKHQISTLILSVNAANLAFESIDKKYQAGLVSYVEYLQALKSKFEAQSQLELAYNELEIAKANYYFRAGIRLISKVTP